MTIQFNLLVPGYMRFSCKFIVNIYMRHRYRTGAAVAFRYLQQELLWHHCATVVIQKLVSKAIFNVKGAEFL